MTSALPDRLDFCCDALSARGALVEASGVDALAVLPDDLGKDLGLPEVCALSTNPGEGAIGVEFGTPLLERLVEGARATRPLVAACMEDMTARANQARALAERWALRNAVHEVTEALPSSAIYAVTWLSWVAEGDDRYEGLVRVVLSERDGGEPDPGFLAAMDGTTLAAGLVEAPLDAPAEAARAEHSRRIAGRALLRAEDALLPVLSAVRRRYERDHERTSEYFAGLVREASTAAARRRVDPAALTQKIAHFISERDAKLRDLAERFALRVSVTPAAAIRVRVPIALVRVNARRRKLDRELALALPAGSSTLDAMPCDGCDAAAARPALCDERLHVLCSRCVPDAQGRFRCPACAGARRSV